MLGELAIVSVGLHVHECAHVMVAIYLSHHPNERYSYRNNNYTIDK